MLTVAIVGASQNRNKFGNKAVRAFKKRGYRVFPVNPAAKEIEGLPTYPSLKEIPVKNIDCISLYVAPETGLSLLDQILENSPAELWLNPGSESKALVEAASALGIKVVCQCSIVAIGYSPSEFP
jgi:predicted CoA-binding protein